jgi:hypothetical protein
MAYLKDNDAELGLVRQERRIGRMKNITRNIHFEETMAVLQKLGYAWHRSEGRRTEDLTKEKHQTSLY